jgi:uncharacterized repeat protein (TIGR02543 family)
MVMPVTFGITYSDLSPRHWCYDKIMDFTDKEYITGYDDGTFRPDITVTRAEFVKIVNNFFGFSGSKSNVTFTDVSSDDWFEPYIKEAVARGYIKGYSDGTFRPNTPIKRQDVIVILARILEIDDEEYSKNHKNGLIQYKDRELVEDWAYKAVQSYTVHGFIEGNGEDVIRVLENITRAETVGFLNVVEKKVEIKRSGSSSRRTTITPVITVYGSDCENEIVIPEEQEWISYDDAAKKIEGYNTVPEGIVQTTEVPPLSISDCDPIESLGAYIEISTETPNANIYKTIDEGSTELYDGRFFLGDGIYYLKSYAVRDNQRQSGTATRDIKIDTKLPVVTGEKIGELEVTHPQFININIYDPENNGEESGLNESSLFYKWVRNVENESTIFTEVNEWTPLILDESGNAQLTAPSDYGIYRLAVSAYDYAGNHFGNDNEMISELIETEQMNDKYFGFVKDDEDEIIEVEVGNNSPTAMPDSIVIDMNEEIIIDVLTNDTDIDNDTLRIDSVGNGELGTASVTEDGMILYTPNLNSKGLDSFEYTLDDGHGGISTGTVNVQIRGFILKKNGCVVSEDGLKLFLGETNTLMTILDSDIQIKNINWHIDDTSVASINNNILPIINITGKKIGNTILTILVTENNDNTICMNVNVDVIPTKVVIKHVYNDGEYSTSDTVITNKKIGDMLNVLDYKDIKNDYYTANTQFNHVIVLGDSQVVTINYVRKSVTVKFIVWKNNVLKTEIVPYGKSATAPVVPNREGYTFTEWDKDFTNVKSNLYVCANYEKNSYKIYFDENEGNEVQDISALFGDRVNLPNATRASHTFDGWATSDDGPVVYLGGAQYTIGNSDITLYAKWTECDDTAPIITITGDPLFIDDTDSKNNDWGYNWNITIDVTDENIVEKILYVWSNSSTQPVDIETTGTVITSGTTIHKPTGTNTGSYYMYVYAEDNYGNSIVDSETFKVDRSSPTEPVIAKEYEGTGPGKKTYLVVDSAGTDNDSGVYKVEYKFKYGPQYSNYALYNSNVQIFNNVNAVKIKVTDNVGNYMEVEKGVSTLPVIPTISLTSELMTTSLELIVPTIEGENTLDTEEVVTEEQDTEEVVSDEQDTEEVVTEEQDTEEVVSDEQDIEEIVSDEQDAENLLNNEENQQEETLLIEGENDNLNGGDNNMYNENYDEENDNEMDLDINSADEDSDDELADVDNEDLEDELNDLEDEDSEDEENDEYSDTEDEEDENVIDEESQEDMDE